MMDHFQNTLALAGENASNIVTKKVIKMAHVRTLCIQ